VAALFRFVNQLFTLFVIYPGEMGIWDALGNVTNNKDTMGYVGA
jgi:hypothetical protein